MYPWCLITCWMHFRPQNNTSAKRSYLSFYISHCSFYVCILLLFMHEVICFWYVSTMQLWIMSLMCTLTRYLHPCPWVPLIGLTVAGWKHLNNCSDYFERLENWLRFSNQNYFHNILFLIHKGEIQNLSESLSDNYIKYFLLTKSVRTVYIRLQWKQHVSKCHYSKYSLQKS